MFKQTLSKWLRKSLPLRWVLLLAVKIFGPKQPVGAVGVIFNSSGHVLLVEHVFRPNYNWGLPGGWVEIGENPAETVRRELAEELGLAVEVQQLLLCDTQGNEPGSTTPPGLALAYYCRLTEPIDNISTHAFEILSVQWINPTAIPWRLPPFQQRAVEIGKDFFDRQANQKLA